MQGAVLYSGWLFASLAKQLRGSEANLTPKAEEINNGVAE